MSEGAASSSTRNSPPKMTKATGLKDQVVPDHEPMPPIFVRKLRKAAVGTGCDIRLRVSVKGTPRPSLTWYHNDTLLPRTEAQDSGGLWIRDCHTLDAGLYTCVAANELGEASCSAILAIMDLGEGTGFVFFVFFILTIITLSLCSHLQCCGEVFAPFSNPLFFCIINKFRIIKKKVRQR